MNREVKLARVDRLDCVIEDHDWPFDRRRRREINAYWANLVSENPSFYDGRVLLARRIQERTEQGARKVLAVGFFETRFSRFLAWRDFGFPDSDVYNCFAMAALRSADGAFLLGEMGAHTANAGSI
ncbi:MAG: NUDIX hydrolase, partial [Methylocystis sp.]|nr:NUDIX hydrolase [Methylocystis sp.]